MINKHVRFLVVAAALCVVVGTFHSVSATESIPVLRGLVAESGSDGPVIHLRTDGELDTVYYSPQPGVWVVEMPEATWQEVDNFLTAPDLGIERAELNHVEEFGKSLSRLTVWLNEPARLELTSSNAGVALHFAGFGKSSPAVQAAGSAVTAHPVPVVENRVSDVPATPVVAASKPSVPVVAETAHTQVEGRAESLYEVAPVISGKGLVIELRGDGPLSGQAFELPAPDRLVVDFPGVVNRVERTLYSINSGCVRQIRIAQFRAYPDPITRMVIDLSSAAEHQLSTTAQGARLVIGDSGSFAPAVVESASDFGAQLPAGAGSITIQRSAKPATSITEPVVRTVVDEAADLPATNPVQPARLEPKTNRSPWVADQSQLIEQAAAGEMLNTRSENSNSFVVTEVETEEQQFTGEPITLTLKDADIKDVLRTFSELTQLNIVLDPGVSGAVTVELRDVPWDQALDLILRINNLDYILENNVLRVAPIAKLAAEKQAKASFAQDEELAQPLRTVLKPVSYARANYIQGLLQGDSYLMSARGTVTVDDRTNTLIIRDVVDRVEGILRLIDSLDMPTPQVVIEGRIVETTKDFSHELGIGWGFTGRMDQEHGNDTGLSFPNEITAAGSTEQLAGGGTHFLAMTFADILDTFNLDFTLRAAESNGTVTIVSTPRVTTQNLTSASIRSGLQIPVQTVSNNTVTVQYVDATLRLQVTPQITAEGTVNLDLNINKREAVLGVAVAGSTNAPIFTREAQTQLLVRDGGTTVIAGIYQINDQESEDSVPGLSKIPIIKYLFKNKAAFRRHDELLIFITPRIVKY